MSLLNPIKLIIQSFNFFFTFFKHLYCLDIFFSIIMFGQIWMAYDVVRALSSACMKFMEA